MDGNNGYRNFFGSYRRPYDRKRRIDDDFDYSDDYDMRNFEREFRDMDGMFAHFHDDMSRQMEEINRQMEDMFRNFGSIDYSPKHYYKPAIEYESPRDKMLKDPDRPSRFPELPDRSRRSIFGDVFSTPRWDSIKPYRRDTDLDAEVAEKSVSKVFEESKSKDSYGSPMKIYSRSNSKSYSSYRGPDGFEKIEKRRSVKNPDGSEETIVSRQLGDKSHTIISKKDKYGHRETDEKLDNLYEGNIPDFQREWNDTNRKTDEITREALTPFKDNRSYFRKFLGIR